jgi:AcrR family transcriptional regulator
MPRKRQSTKSRIVKAAWNLFYKNGYDQTTVEDIITASKTSKGTFYHYFKGKEALLNSLSYLFDQKYEELSAVMDPSLSAL